MHLTWDFLLSLVICAMIVLPSVIIALVEIFIEGPFGWSALTFTKRYAPDSRFSKFYRALNGQDKWATAYHLYSNLVWLFICVLSLGLYPLYGLLDGHFAWPAFAGVSAIALAIFIMIITIEDFVFFVINPYYGLARYNKNFVPWVQNYTLGIRKEYWHAFISTFALVGLVAWLLNSPDLLAIWTGGFGWTVLVTFGGFRLLDKKIQRQPLAPQWWKKAEIVVIIRCPYSVERAGFNPEIDAYVISPAVMADLIRGGKAEPLRQVLAGE